MFGYIHQIVVNQFQLDINSDHGFRHWEKIEKIGIYLAKHTKADITVIKLFALLHDSKRENEFDDPLHGIRAAQFVEELFKKRLLPLTQFQLTQLIYACKFHSDSLAKSEDMTVQICWDSDRLDLWRIGITPNPLYLYTDTAKKAKTILWAKNLKINHSQKIKEYIKEEFERRQRQFTWMPGDLILIRRGKKRLIKQ